MSRAKKSGTLVRVEYLGQGEYINGIPTQDMGPEQWDKIPGFIRKKGLDAGLYREIWKEKNIPSSEGKEDDE